jgi:predicted phage terminase large subunit-like protein
VIGAALVSIALTLASLAPPDRATFIASLTTEEALVLQYTWAYWARPNQTIPQGDWSTWMVLAGRGFGKTRVGAQQVHQWATELGPSGRIALVGKDPADIRKTMVEGESGLLACAAPWFYPTFEPTKRVVVWPNGCRGFTYSAEVPDDLRGPQHHKFWGDELCKWRFPQETWDNLQFGLRLGDNPQGVVTTTPSRIKTLREILTDPGTVTTRGSTYDNAANLPQKFLDYLKRKYEGTTLGRQELFAELIEDVEGALWTHKMVDDQRVRQAPAMRKIVVAIDPAASSGPDASETGIVVAGVGEDGHGYVLEDLSDRYTPDGWATKAVDAFDRHQADAIIAEKNNGGEMVEHTVRTVRKLIPYRAVHASRGKRTRAEPVAALYEQKRVHHVGTFAQLEDQMTTWVPGMESPDRMDGLVWALTDLIVTGPGEAAGAMEEPEDAAAVSGLRRRFGIVGRPTR